MYHLRIVAPEDKAHRALDLLCESPSVTNVVHLHGAALDPPGDLILADVAREDTSVILHDLKEMGLDRDGASIALEEIDTSLSREARKAEEAAKGSPADAVVWEQVEARTSEDATLSGSFIAFMVLATLIAAVGIMLDSPVLIVGAMVVGPEFGPIAGFCVAAVTRRSGIAVRSFVALAIGFPVAIGAAYLTTLLLKETGLTPDDFAFDNEGHGLASGIAHPDFFAFFVAFCAGIAGMLSLTTAKSGALIGVLISVTTIPAAAAVAVAAAFSDWDAMGGSAGQLGINVASILAAGTLTLAVQRAIYQRRERAHQQDLKQSSPAMTTHPPSS
jgi:uncharacterized hydrophobic protein (TIGR00271 family)